MHFLLLDNVACLLWLLAVPNFVTLCLVLMKMLYILLHELVDLCSLPDWSVMRCRTRCLYYIASTVLYWYHFNRTLSNPNTSFFLERGLQYIIWGVGGKGRLYASMCMHGGHSIKTYIHADNKFEKISEGSGRVPEPPESRIPGDAAFASRNLAKKSIFWK